VSLSNPGIYVKRAACDVKLTLPTHTSSHNKYSFAPARRGSGVTRGQRVTGLRPMQDTAYSKGYAMFATT